MTEMIYVYGKMPDDLTVNGDALIDWADLPEISRVLNDKFSFYGNYRLNGQNVEKLKENNFIKALTENGTWQYFEIFSVKKTLYSVSVTARFIGAMANKNFIEKSYTASGNGTMIMRNLFNSLAFSQKFTYTSNIPTVHQFTANQVKPIDAIIGSNNGGQNLVGVTGGEFDVDNYDLKLVKQIGVDNNYRIDFGVNLEAIETEIDNECYNSLYLVGAIPENDYDADKDPITYKYLEVAGVTDATRRIAKRENTNCKTVEELKAWGQTLFDKDRIHEPKATHRVNMVALEHTIEYGELYRKLAALHFGDIAYCSVPDLALDLRERMVEYVWFPTLQKYKTVVLGNSLSKYTSRVQTDTQKLADKIANRTETLVQSILDATAWITGNKGGHVVFRPEKAPSEILIMDTKDVATAKRVWRWNLNGLGYSDNGINGPFGVAITSKGEIVADFITAGILRAISIIGVDITGATITGTDIFGSVIETLTPEGVKMRMASGSIQYFDAREGKDDARLGSIGMFTPNEPVMTLERDIERKLWINDENLVLMHKDLIQLLTQEVSIQGKLNATTGNIRGRLDVKELYVDGVKLIPGQGGGGPGSGATYEPININNNIKNNPNIVAWLDKYTKQYGIHDYIGLAYALIMVENPSTDGTDDIMQSSESAGYPGPGYLTGEASVDQGCKHLANVLNSSFAKNVDVWGAMQSYNFGAAYVDWLAARGGKNTTDLAVVYSRDVVAPSLGNTTGETYPYINDVSIADGRTWLYLNGGNFHYAAMIRQYVKVTEKTWRAPIDNPITVTSEFGWRTDPFGSGAQEFHNAIDLVGGTGNTTNIYASGPGTVVFADWENSYGNYVIIKHANGLFTGYAHNSSLSVGVGDTVSQGQKIANMGSTGSSTDPHTHFQFFRNGPWPSSNNDFINPREYVEF